MESRAWDYLTKHYNYAEEDIKNFINAIKDVVSQELSCDEGEEFDRALRYKFMETISYLNDLNKTTGGGESEIDLPNLPYCHFSQLNPEIWETYRKRHQAEINNAIKGDVVATTELYKCGRCKQRKCTYTWSQTRSADEGVTMMFRCTNCGNRWTVNN